MLVSLDRSPGSRPPSLAVIEAVARREGIDPTELEPPEYEPLYEVLNPEALDAVFAPRDNGAPRSTGRIEFSYCGYDVVVSSDGSVELSK